ncbi:MAG: phosphatase PAP2 family protein [Nocardioidaceae bacterium]
MPGPLRPLDLAFNQFRGEDFDMVRPYLQVLDRIGQRAVCLPILAAAAAWASHKAKTWRPMIVTAVSVLGVNAFVAVFKFGLERGAPLDNEPDFLAGGVMYPSGHAANVLLVYGLAAYLLLRYADSSRRMQWTLMGVVGALTVVMFITSLSLRWHWFTDLVAGVIVGGAALKTAITVDRAIPFTPLTETEEQVTRPVHRHRATHRQTRPRRSPQHTR